jgi:flagellar biosynthesis/type III secretory pathway M-ring protein FliF/YscJ
MSVQVNGDDIMAVIHVVRIVGTLVTMLVVGLLLWWAVRPSRRARDRREEIEADPADHEDLWRIVDRKEERLAVLERALADQIDAPLVRAPRQDRIYAPADEDRVSGRTE